MKPRVYLETSFVSYLTARRSRSKRSAEAQRITRAWWRRRKRFELFVSKLVLDEASRGDRDAARRRLQALAGIVTLVEDLETESLSRLLLERLAPVPGNDATHLALAVVNGMDYVLTWNCAHMANAATRRRFEDVCRHAGRHTPVICTPGDLTGG